ncbi:MAG TPA: MraY family glycosyltransferase [Terracidiphilus sp.]|nr:MraY family glycosyltransferase [Terracidiphilus sp.]
MAILLAYALAFGGVLLARFHADVHIFHRLQLVTWLAPAALLIFATGFIDDLWGLRPWQKLIGEIGAALMVYWAGVRVQDFAGHHLLSWLQLPLTVLWLVACTNAVNLIDGVDGLAAGVGLFATCTILFAALLQNNVALAIATAPLAGSLLGFLRYNFNPATIFLGDCGSLLIGFLLGCYGVLWSDKAATMLGMTAPLMALSIPLLDTSLAIARRFLRRRPVFTADRGHIHHRLLDRGLTPRRVALILYAFSALGAMSSLLMMNKHVSGFVIILFCAITWMGVQHLGYVEFGTAGRMFLDGAFRRMLNSQISLQTHYEQLIAAPTPECCWEIILDACRGAGYHRVELTLAGRAFQWQDGVDPMNTWDVTIPISDSDYVRLTRSFGGGPEPNIIAPFADLLRHALIPKLPVFAAMSHQVRVEMSETQVEANLSEEYVYEPSARGD